MLPLFLRRTVPLLLAVSAFALFAAPAAVHAKSGDSGDAAGIDVNFFYDTLKEDGSWYNTSEYGDVWQPYIAYKSDTWRPYTDGYWSYTDGGWMFVSNENFGWAVYHYGRWTRLKDIGWAWVPGTDWAPAWVTWRASKPAGNGPPAGPDGAPAPGAAIDANSTNAPAADDKNPPPPATDQSAPPPPRAPSGNDSAGGPPPSDNFIGWAPLPPEPQAYTTVDYSYGPTVDVDFGIDPYDYCFTDVRYFGAPYVAAVIFDPFRSYYYAGNSVNITNIYYNHNGGYRGFYAGGPRYESFRGVTQRPIPQYNIRQTGGAAAQAAIRRGQFNRVNGKTIGVAAPQFSRAGVAPDGKVKLTRAGALAKAEVNRGAPAAAVDNPAYKQARESFTKQGDAYRAQHPEAAGTHSRAAALGAAGLNSGGAQPETAPKIQTTTRAQEEERAARQAAGGNAPMAEGQSREAALKERAAGGTPEAANEKGGAPKAAEAHPEPAGAGAAAGETRRSRHGSRHETARQTGEGQPTAERHSESSHRERGTESTGRSRAASVPHVEQHSAPRPVAVARPQGGGGGGSGEKKDDKKKK